MSQITGPRAAQVGRRGFLGALGTATTAAVAAASVSLDPRVASAAEAAAPETPSGDRIADAYAVRLHAANRMAAVPLPAHVNNGDETGVPNYAANYSKALPHDGLGHVDPSAYGRLLDALASGGDADFEAITLGPGHRLLTNPRAGLSFDCEGLDPQQFAQPPAPAFASAEAAGEMVELYWMSLLRDVNFLVYGAHPLAAAAVLELDHLSDFHGPRQGGHVTPQTLFRDDLPGALVGPYVSQFMWLDTPFGAESVFRRIRTLLPHTDHATRFEDWLGVQDGFVPGSEHFDPVHRYIRNGRDLAQWVHVDVLFQAYFNACLILGTPPSGGGLGCPLNPSNPHLGSQTQLGFGTWGLPFIKTMLREVATRALKAVWFQKWFVHRRLRPEEFGGRVHVHKSGLFQYPLHRDVLTSRVIKLLKVQNGSWLLPLAFPEGSPTNPAYGAGHATVAGACVTLLKAFFDEESLIAHPVVPNLSGTSLLPYNGPPLPVGGELNKLASNVATGRNIAGVHWRSDARESLLLGERVAIELLKDALSLGPEDMGEGVSFTGFDGSTVSVTP
jgi:hypothetical protein